MKWIDSIISFAMLAGTFLCIYTPDVVLFKSGADFAVQIMFGLFIFAFIFMVFNQEKLMLLSFLCCGVLCLFLRNSFHEELMLPQQDSPIVIKSAYFNLSSSLDYQSTIDAMKKTQADIIFIQELTPNWTPILKKELSETHPFHKSIVRIDFFGLSVFSNLPFHTIDTFNYKGLPNIVGSVIIDSISLQKLYFVSSHLSPPVNDLALEDSKNHLYKITEQVKQHNSPTITIGGYNMVSWRKEIQDFKRESSLNDSRRSFIPNSIFDTHFPTDHIFYSSHLRCLEFKMVIGSSSETLGLLGTFQLKQKYVDDKEPYQ